MKRTRIAVVVAAAMTVCLVAAGAEAARSTLSAQRPSKSMAMTPSTLASQLALAREATVKYVTDLDRAKADGYGIITRMIPYMGYHFLNPKVTGFDVRKPAILVYEHRAGKWQLAALEWVFPAKPAKAPLPGARYGSFPAACHYADGTFVPEATQDACPQASPQTGAKFGFWHPNLVTLHVWIWYPNPSGLYASMNPLAAAFNQG
jgi:hypothetical protein